MGLLSTLNCATLTQIDRCYLVSGAVAVAVPTTIYFIWRHFQGGQFTKPVRMDGKVAIITGASVGLGRENTREFALRGGRVYMAVRTLDDAHVVRDAIVAETKNPNVFVLKLDLGSQKSVRAFVEEFKKRETRLDILVNNAALMAVPKRTLTHDGYEVQLGYNHLGHFLLTNLLLDMLKKSAPSRIVNLSSSCHHNGVLRRDNLNSEKSYAPYSSYCQSKLITLLFTRELAKRLQGTGVVANTVHPGIVRTNLQRYPLLRIILLPLYYLTFKTPRAGVQTQLAVALDPELATTSGKYFTDCEVEEESEEAQSDEDAQWLWEQSEKMTGLAVVAKPAEEAKKA